MVGMSPSTSFIPPMLRSLVDQPPEGDLWLHEIKYDGCRTQLVIDTGRVRAFTRNGYDWSDRYRPIVDAAQALRCSSAIIDGELCVQGPNGVTDYAGLLRAIGSAPERLVLFAFDLMEIDGQDLRAEPLVDRRARLEELIGPPDSSHNEFSPHHIGDGQALFGAADAAGLEGIVSKRAASCYTSGRSDTWRKAKCFAIDEFEVLGVDRSASGIPIALLSRVGSKTYAGDAMIALKAEERAEFWAAIERLGTPRARLAGMAKRKTAKWVRAGLRARVRHLRGGDKLLRHATLQRLDLWDPLHPLRTIVLGDLCLKLSVVVIAMELIAIPPQDLDEPRTRRPDRRTDRA